MVQLSNGHVVAVSIIILCELIESESKPNERYYVRKDAAKEEFSKLLKTIAVVNERRLNALKRYEALDKYNLVSGVLRHTDDKERHPVLTVFLLNNNEDNIQYGISNRNLDKSRDILDENIFLFSKEFQNDLIVNNGDIYKKDLRNRIELLNKDKMENISDENRNKSDEETSDGEEITPRKDTSLAKNTSLGQTKETKKNKEKLKHPIKKMDDKDVLRIWRSCSKKAAKVCIKACKKTAKNVCDSYRCSTSMKRSFKRNCKSNCKERFFD